MSFRLGLELHPTRDVSAEVGVVVGWARSHGAQVVAADSGRLVPEGVLALADDELADTCDGVVAIGGDGTVLGALRRLVRRPVPVLGVNRGTVGFLTEVDPATLPQALDRLSAGNFTVEDRPCLEVSGPEGASAAAFNDVALTRLPGQGFGTVRVDVDGTAFGAYRCDALVVATAMGSTAYNYAAHGPLVSPHADVVVVTPVAPASGPDRSLVLSAAEPLMMAVQGSRMALELDGSVHHELGHGDSIDVRLVPGAGRLVRLDPEAYGRRSLIKLTLQDLPLPREELHRLLGGPPEEA